jgi:hypothetical protein
VRVAGKAIELGDEQHGTAAAALGERGGELGRSPPLPISTSSKVATTAPPKAAAGRVTASRWASRPRPERLCLSVETR